MPEYPSLTNFDIDTFFKGNGNYSGCVSKHQLKNVNNGKFYVVNIDDDPIGNGTHWVAVLGGKRYNCYFDPFGVPPDDTIMKILKKNRKKVLYNTNQIQHLESVMCGYYCVHFCEFMDKKSSKENHQPAYLRFLLQFSDDPLENEKTIRSIFDNK